jgi:hypothetical protein
VGDDFRKVKWGKWHVALPTRTFFIGTYDLDNPVRRHPPKT